MFLHKHMFSILLGIGLEIELLVYGNSIFSFRNCQVGFQSSYTILYSHQQYYKGFSFLHIFTEVVS